MRSSLVANASFHFWCHVGLQIDGARSDGAKSKDESDVPRAVIVCKGATRLVGTYIVCWVGLPQQLGVQPRSRGLGCVNQEDMAT